MLSGQRQGADFPRFYQVIESDTSIKGVIDCTCSEDSLEAHDVPIEALPFKVGLTDGTLE